MPSINTKKYFKTIKIKSFLRTPKFPTITKNSEAAKAVLRLLIEGEDEINPVLRVLREEQIARNLLLLGPTLLAGILLVSQHRSSPLNHVVVSLCLMIVSIGEASIFMGLLFRRLRRRLSIALELTGIMLMLLSFFVYISFHLPRCISWLPILCFSLCLVPLYDAARSIFVQSNPASENVPNRV